MRTLEEVIDYFSEVADAYSDMACEASLQQDYDRMVAFQQKANDERQLVGWLKVLKEIQDCGSCNDCQYKGYCGIEPKPGQMVRYNCHQYKRKVKADDDD